MPSPSASTPLKHPDQRFADSEAFTERFAAHLAGSMEKVNRRAVKRWGELAHDKNELGAVLNGFSLTEPGKLGDALEKVGQAVDAGHMSTAALLQAWERSVTEPLHVYAQFAQIIRQRLAFRHQKHVQYELVQDTLEQQRDKLEELEKAEAEARRLEDALESGGRGLTGSMVRSEEEVRAERERQAERRRKATGGGGGYGFLSALKHSVSGMMDVDPEATRRANIGKTRDNITQVGAEPRRRATCWLTPYDRRAGAARGFPPSLCPGPQICQHDATGGSGPLPAAKGGRPARPGHSSRQHASGLVQAGEHSAWETPRCLLLTRPPAHAEPASLARGPGVSTGH